MKAYTTTSAGLSLPAALLLAALCLCLTSCSDDDSDKDSGTTEEQQAQQAQEQADLFWNVASQLVNPMDYTADYHDKTFEPTIGEPQEGNPHVRVVSTNDMASAAERFASLVGLDNFDLNATTYEWKADGVGTLTYRKTDNGTSWATVDVSIKQIPQLQQIVYQSPTQGGANGTFDGSAYYRFGDVVSRVNDDKQTEYWICVRPAFGPEGKGESHWVTLSPLPNKNLELIQKYGRDFYLPKGLGVNEEQMQNLAEMLWAIRDPDAWFNNVGQFSAPTLLTTGLRMFHDFSHHKDMRKYHNEFFWKRVRQAWDEQGIFKLILGLNPDDEKFPFFSPLYGNGEILHLLYKGHSWWKRVSNDLSLYEYSFENGDETRYLNMHKATKREVKKDMTKLNFNAKTEYTLDKPYLIKPELFGNDEPRYFVRHATGQELAAKGSKWDKQQPISGVKPVYVYNHYFYPEGTDGAANGQHFRDLTIKDPEVTPNNNSSSDWNRDAYNGNSYYTLGDVCIDEEGSRWFCVLNSGSSFMPKTNDALLNSPFSYFITFDNIYDAEGELASDIAQEATVPKVLMPLLSFFSNYSASKLLINTKIYNNVKDNTGVDLLKIALMRDSVVVETDTKMENSRNSSFTNVAIFNKANKQWQLMRIVQDGAYDKRHNRQWHYFFYTKYENTDQPILLSDIASQEKVNRYAPDRWAVLPISGTKQRQAIRTQADPRATDIRNYQWVDGTPRTDATSMWNEPVLVFRITKVYDRGVNHATCTYHNNMFTDIILSPIHQFDSEMEMIRSSWLVNAVGSYIQNAMTMDGETYHWNDWNNDYSR